MNKRLKRTNTDAMRSSKKQPSLSTHLVPMPGVRKSPARNDLRRSIKRIADICLAACGLIPAFPVMLCTAAAVRVTMGPPVLFRQTRTGLNGRLFTLYKFRTMNDARDEKGEPLPDSERLTPIGRFIRRTSLDELPQLINVLKGEMSLVGPRPLLVEYLDRYSAEQNRRHEVKPGITGWTQVNGRNAMSWEEKFRHDVWYVDNWSLALDAKILLMTVVKTIKGEGVTPEHGDTVEYFMGSGERASGTRPEDASPD